MDTWQAAFILQGLPEGRPVVGRWTNLYSPDVGFEHPHEDATKVSKQRYLYDKGREPENDSHRMEFCCARSIETTNDRVEQLLV